jgi:phospholipid/cholesterol/gamma-HCH transport system substrate-binding protein
MIKKYKHELSVGIFVFIGLICIAYLTIKLGKMELFSAGGYTLTAKFEAATGLRKGASVELAGVQVGKVISIDLDRKTYAAVVEIKIESQVELSDDVIASIKTSGLIGDKYISLSPGGSPAILKDGDEITETLSPMDIESLLSKYVFGGVK